MTQQSWGLSLYELHRKPHELINDGMMVAVGRRTVRSELMCPICLDILKNTMTTKDCVHRFCQECITTALRNGNKECPTCRQKLVSKRSLRPDRNIDDLIAKLYPNRVAEEKRNDQLIERARQHMLAMSRKRESGQALKDQDAPEAKRSSKSSVEVVNHSHHSSLYSIQAERIELRLFPRPDEPQTAGMKPRLLSSSPPTLIGHLIKYLSLSYASDKRTKKESPHMNDKQYAISISFPPNADPPEYINLLADVTLEQVCNKYWKPDEVLDLYYSEVKETTT